MHGVYQEHATIVKLSWTALAPFHHQQYLNHAGTPPFTKPVINVCLSFSCQSEVQHAICNGWICRNNAEESRRHKHCNKWETVWMWKGNECIVMARCAETPLFPDICITAFRHQHDFKEHKYKELPSIQSTAWAAFPKQWDQCSSKPLSNEQTDLPVILRGFN